MGELGIALATGVLALFGVALGGWMSRRAASEALEIRLREDRRQIIHRTMAELITDARQKIDLAWVMIPAMAKMSIDDMTEYVGADSGREAGERERRINRSIVELGLLIGDTHLRDALGELEACLTDWSEKAVGPVIAPPRRRTGKRGPAWGVHNQTTVVLLAAVAENAWARQVWYDEARHQAQHPPDL